MPPVTTGFLILKHTFYLSILLEKTLENDYYDDEDEYDYATETKIKTTTDSEFLSGLKDKLGIAHKNTPFRSTSDKKKQKEGFNLRKKEKLVKSFFSRKEIKQPCHIITDNKKGIWYKDLLTSIIN